MSLYEKVQETANVIKRQTALMERTYDNKPKDVISVSSAMHGVFDQLDLAQNSADPVLIEGEGGICKELFSTIIHYNSPRRDKMFIMQNCSAFSETRLSSALFGHAKGAFSGATSNNKGLFELSDGGTLFLDGIGDMNVEVQEKLLRVLEIGTFCAVDGTEEKKINVRIIAATNKELKKQVEKGLFKEDLYFKIGAIHITIPPLGERKDDILHLADYLIETYAEIHNSAKKQLSQEAIDRLVLVQ